MDRTLVDVHTARLYLRLQRELGEIGRLDLLRSSFWLFQYGLGLVNAEQVALRVLVDYRGKSELWLRERCRDWFGSHVRPWVSPVGRERVRQHQLAGDHVAIATSAIRQAAQPLADELSILHLVCSELTVVGGELTGTFEPPLCYGAGKLGRVQTLLDSLGCKLEDTAFYSDSITDLPLLEAVGRPIVVNPDLRLQRLARRRGWPIEDWLGARAAAEVAATLEAPSAPPRQP